MFFVNFWGGMLAFCLAVLTGEGNAGALYCKNHPDIIPYIQMTAILSAIGQNFIFFTISNFNSLTLATITTVRKLLTFVTSVIVFEHDIRSIQWVGVGLVFSGLIYELICRKGDIILAY
jgi:UDP-galactose transporter B1